MSSILEKIMDKVSPEPNSGCWLWMGALGRDGYGQTSFPYLSKSRRAHRISWELFRGEIPKGMVLDHLCRVHSCVNPDHLQVVTSAENIKRGFRDRAHKKPDCCTKGHPYDAENTYFYGIKREKRGCKACRRKNVSNFWKRKRTASA